MTFTRKSSARNHSGPLGREAGEKTVEMGFGTRRARALARLEGAEDGEQETAITIVTAGPAKATRNSWTASGIRLRGAPRRRSEERDVAGADAVAASGQRVSELVEHDAAEDREDQEGGRDRGADLLAPGEDAEEVHATSSAKVAWIRTGMPATFAICQDHRMAAGLRTRYAVTRLRYRASQSCTSRFQTIELRGFRIQWFSSGKNSRRASTPFAL